MPAAAPHKSPRGPTAWRPMAAGGLAIAVVALMLAPLMRPRPGLDAPRADEAAAPAPIVSGGDAPGEDLISPSGDGRFHVASAPPAAAARPAAPSTLKQAPARRADPPVAAGRSQFIVGVKASEVGRIFTLWRTDRTAAQAAFAAWAARQNGAFAGMRLVDVNPYAQELVVEADDGQTLSRREMLERLKACPHVNYADHNAIGQTQQSTGPDR